MPASAAGSGLAMGLWRASSGTRVILRTKGAKRMIGAPTVTSGLAEHGVRRQPGLSATDGRE